MFDRDEQEISQMIESGLEAILSGEATLEEVLARHPEQAGILQPELEGALWLMSRQQEVEARPGFVAASRRRLVERIKAEADGQGARHALFGFAWPKRLAFQWVLTAAVLLLLLTSTGGVLSISDTALPGDNLYALKRAAEQVTYSVTLDQVERVELSAQFADRRLKEAKTLIDKGDYATAETSLQAYEQSIHQTVYLLEQVSDHPSGEVEQLTVNVKQNFAKNVNQLSTIAVQHREDDKVNARLQSARDVSINGVMTADKVYEKIQEKKSAPPTDTSQPNPTSAPLINTPQPALPVQPTSTPAAPTSAPPTAVPPPAFSPPAPPPTSVPVKPSQPTATPAPTNTVAPTSTSTTAPTPLPSDTPAPTTAPTPLPSSTPPPTSTPTDVPTPQPSSTSVPTVAPTAAPSSTAAPLPINTSVPTTAPTAAPTTAPTDTPAPLTVSTQQPTAVSTSISTLMPTVAPIIQSTLIILPVQKSIVPIVTPTP